MPRGGDCDGDLTVSVDEVVTGVGIALEREELSACPPIDRNQDRAASVDELVTAVDSLLKSGMRNPEQSLLYTSLTYGDPLVVSFDPARRYLVDTLDDERTLTYCALYDNGFTDPATVKRRSRVPPNGASCRPTKCAEGRVGEPCGSDRDCDTSAGAADGACDACTLAFGLSTDDEMFVLIGSFVSE